MTVNVFHEPSANNKLQRQHILCAVAYAKVNKQLFREIRNPKSKLINAQKIYPGYSSMRIEKNIII